ncbi:MAG TPA: 2-dehydropantoate 2-reductase N-terminal domain-containing protein [Nevskiaceae bacterium]|nr:2-dehydropantoate 2-reductase N-terminal domain-containing protein [Nevskiaceae bacterium]
MKVAVVGSGFVGQATGRGFKKHGNDVTFIDVVEDKVKALRDEGFDAHLADRYSTITTDVTLFCVPTPTKGRSIQLEYLRDAVSAFAERLKTHDKYHVAVIRSTVPPGTTRKNVLSLIEKISGKKAGKDFGLCMQPEYLREVTANEDFERPWFILIGQFDEKSGDVLEKLYRSFDAPIQRCSLDEAEFQKYVHNVYNAVKIAFFNEMRSIAKGENWNADAVFRATAESCEGIWNPLYGLRDFGPFDGSCLPKDTRALLQWGDSNDYDLGILRAVIVENLKHEKLLGKNKTVRVNYLENISV